MPTKIQFYMNRHQGWNDLNGKTPEGDEYTNLTDERAFEELYRLRQSAKEDGSSIKYKAVYVKNVQAYAAFVAKKVEIENLLLKIMSSDIQSKNADSVEWSDVGSQNRVIELLTEVDGFIHGTAK